MHVNFAPSFSWKQVSRASVPYVVRFQFLFFFSFCFFLRKKLQGWQKEKKIWHKWSWQKQQYWNRSLSPGNILSKSNIADSTCGYQSQQKRYINNSKQLSFLVSPWRCTHGPFQMNFLMTNGYKSMHWKERVAWKKKKKGQGDREQREWAPLHLQLISVLNNNSYKNTEHSEHSDTVWNRCDFSQSSFFTKRGY